MSTPSSWDDAQIHAYVDGELDAQAAAQLEADGREDAILTARIAQQRKLRALLRGAFDPVLKEPIPQRLRDALSGTPAGATVTPISASRSQRAQARRPVWSLREWSAIAATLVLGVLVGMVALRKPGLSLEIVHGQLLARGEIDTALSTQLSGSAATGATTRVALSFRAADGRWCRTFSKPDGPSGVACRSEGHWSVQFLDASHASAPRGAPDYRQAASSLSPAMLGALAGLGAGDALTPAQEQQLLRAGWE